LLPVVNFFFTKTQNSSDRTGKTVTCREKSLQTGLLREFTLRKAAQDISNDHNSRRSRPTDVSSQPPVDNPRTSFISPHGADVAPTGQENARTLVERENERTTSDETATTADGNGPATHPSTDGLVIDKNRGKKQSKKTGDGSLFDRCFIGELTADGASCQV